MAKQRSRQPQRGARSRHVKRNVPRGCFHIKTSFNNTIITVTDPEGNVLRWLTPGSVGFQGTRKSTPFAARVAAERLAQDAISNEGMREVDVFVSGAGPGREASLRAIAAAGLRVRSIVDATPIPHNGCRPPKKRRI
ncbi:MAG: 30S ribosomal protein S11 [Anaerolineae bacterium]|nr:30S ribosomal protein S11 [Anaerolineae bacterium]